MNWMSRIVNPIVLFKMYYLGEVGAGKSSAINLILDVDLLPTNALRCTNTIVEIRSSADKRKEAICYHKTQSPDGSYRKKYIEMSMCPRFSYGECPILT